MIYLKNNLKIQQIHHLPEVTPFPGVSSGCSLSKNSAKLLSWLSLILNSESFTFN